MEDTDISLLWAVHLMDPWNLVGKFKDYGTFEKRGPRSVLTRNVGWNCCAIRQRLIFVREGISPCHIFYAGRTELKIADGERELEEAVLQLLKIKIWKYLFLEKRVEGFQIYTSKEGLCWKGEVYPVESRRYRSRRTS